MGPLPLDAVRDDIRRMTGYTPGEQVDHRIKLNTNECAWPPAPTVLAALGAIAAERLRLYPDPRSTRLRELAAATTGTRPDQVLVGNGSDDCLTVIFRSLLRPGDIVRCPWPTYGLYETCAAIQGAVLEKRPWSGLPDRWDLPADLAAAGARLLVLANPNNPSGTLVPPDRLRALADGFAGIVVADEAYIDFAPPGSSLLPHLDAHPNLVVLRTCSKSYAMAGARLGLLFAHANLVRECDKVKDSYNVNALTQAVGAAALANEAYHADLVRKSLANRADLAADLARRGWTVVPSAANFVLCRVGPRAGAIYRALRDRGILVRWWPAPELAECLRISVGTDEEQALLAAALDEVAA